MFIFSVTKGKQTRLKLKKSSFFDVMCERSGTKLTEKKKENMNNVCV